MNKSAKNIILNSGDVESKRAEILEYFKNTYDLSTRLFDVLVDGAFYRQANTLRHPLIFYFGHTATFFTNKLVLAKILDKRIDENFESMFAIGVDEMSWDDLNDQNYDWPSIDEVREYRAKVRSKVCSLIKTIDFSIPINWESPMWIIMMGIEHDRIHFETSSVLFRELGLEYLRNNQEWPICQIDNTPVTNELLKVQGAVVELGRKRDDNRCYGWDNEYGYKKVEVKDFKASKYLVSNKEFLEFVQNGGYKNKEYWSEEGKAWLGYTKSTHPHFWIKDGDTYKFRTMLKVIDMPWSWPAEVNYLEAEAFCNFKGDIRLPSEEEWYRLREVCKVPDEPDWDKAPANINLEHFCSSVPVDTFKFGEFYDVIGNVWQWTSTHMDGFDGFEPHYCYDDFSIPTFDERHNLIKGGSWISTGNEALKDSRYAFRRHFFQHAGFRYVQKEGTDMKEEKELIYESNKSVTEYLEFHYGSTYFDVANFPKRCVDLTLQYAKNKQKTKALDIGCAVGRASFELAREYDHVTGIDFSAKFIQHAFKLQQDGHIKYTCATEGDLVDKKEVTLESLGFQSTANKCEFAQGDATNLKPMYSGYDLVLALNLIDRLYDPKKFLEDISTKINDNGLLVIASPYTWLEEFTQKKSWLGGYLKDGVEVSTFDTLKEILCDKFNFIARHDVEFVIRETKRKYQHTVSNLSIWEKK